MNSMLWLVKEQVNIARCSSKPIHCSKDILMCHGSNTEHLSRSIESYEVYKVRDNGIVSMFVLVLGFGEVARLMIAYNWTRELLGSKSTAMV